MENYAFYLLPNGTVAAVSLPAMAGDFDGGTPATEGVYMLDKDNAVFGSIAGSLLTREISADDAEQRQPELFDRLRNEREAQAKYRLIDFYLKEELEYDDEAYNTQTHDPKFDYISAWSMASYLVVKALRSDDYKSYLDRFLSLLKHDKTPYAVAKKAYIENAIKNIQEKLK